MNSAIPKTFPIIAAEFLLPVPAGLVELSCNLPDQAEARAGTAIICHPHSLHGGTMHNKVVTMLERSLRELGLATIRFNFRGVGQSTGNFDEGLGETNDLKAIAAWARQVRPHDALWLAGFSFGSYVALRATAGLAPAQLIQVAPPVGRWSFDGIALPQCPWLIIQGEEDELVDPQTVFNWVGSLPHPPMLVRLPETSHFFHRKLMDLRDAVKNNVRTNLPPRLADNP